jgi:xanthine/uracil permease
MTSSRGVVLRIGRLYGEARRRVRSAARSTSGWTALLALFGTGLTAGLWLRTRAEPPSPTDTVALAAYGTFAAGVLTVIFAQNWKYRAGVIFGDLLISRFAIAAAGRLECHSPYSGPPAVCDRLYGVHLLALFSAAVGLMFVMYVVVPLGAAERQRITRR